MQRKLLHQKKTEMVKKIGRIWSKNLRRSWGPTHDVRLVRKFIRGSLTTFATTAFDGVLSTQKQVMSDFVKKANQLMYFKKELYGVIIHVNTITWRFRRR